MQPVIGYFDQLSKRLGEAEVGSSPQLVSLPQYIMTVNESDKFWFSLQPASDEYEFELIMAIHGELGAAPRDSSGASNQAMRLLWSLSSLVVAR